MKNPEARMKYRRSIAGMIAGAAALSVATFSFAQDPAFYQTVEQGFLKQVAPLGNGETPRLSNGKPDLTGFWASPVRWGLGNVPPPPGVIYGARHLGTGEPDQAMMNRARTNRPIYKPEYWEKVQSLDFGLIVIDPQFSGKPQGVPRNGPPAWVVQSKDWISIFSGLYSSEVRLVPTDGRPLTDFDKGGDTDLGIGVGHWEGDVLVIESEGFGDRTWLYWAGYFHTVGMKVTERYTRRGNLLIYDVTVDDPEVLQEPWVLDTNIRVLNTKGERPEEIGEFHENDGTHIPDPYYRG
jgi:hypothetical protein